MSGSLRRAMDERSAGARGAGELGAPETGRRAAGDGSGRDVARNRQAQEEDRFAEATRKRIDALLDPASFTELDGSGVTDPVDRGQPSGSPHVGVVGGYGTVDGRPVCVLGVDAGALYGDAAEAAGARVVRILDLAVTVGCPVIELLDATTVHTVTGVSGLAAHGHILRARARASRCIPQVTVVLGRCVAEAVHTVAAADFTVMVDRTSTMSAARPGEIEAVTGDRVDLDELAGGLANALSGGTHYLAQDEDDAIDFVQVLLGYLPSSSVSDVPRYGVDRDGAPVEPEPGFDRVLPRSPDRPYDVLDLIELLVDDGELLELHALFAPNVVTGLGRIEGQSVGIVANQPLRRAGLLDVDAMDKVARFVATCDRFGIPLVTLVDVPGLLPGRDQERVGVGWRGSTMVAAFAGATVPLITLVTRRASGSAYTLMCSKQLGADVSLAWPTAQIDLRHPDGVAPRHGRDPGPGRPPRDTAVLNAGEAAQRGVIDQVIAPAATRSHIGRALSMLTTKRTAATAARGMTL